VIVTRQLVPLLVGSLAIWLLLAIPAWLLAGDTGLLDTAIASGLCLVPMTATMLWCQWAFSNAPEQQLLAVLGGTSVRLVVVIAGGIALNRTVEALHRPAFLLWVVVFYLATLTLEIVLVVRRQTVDAKQLAPESQQTQP
jgi:hypothetical protein